MTATPSHSAETARSAGVWLTASEQSAWRAVLLMRGPLMAELNRRLGKDSGLSLADYDVLVALSESGTASMAISDLLVATNWEASRLSHQLSRMEQRGLVFRRSSVGDGRRSEVVLCTLGAEAIEKAAPTHVAAVRELLIDRLTDEQVAALAEIGGRVAASPTVEG